MASAESTGVTERLVRQYCGNEGPRATLRLLTEDLRVTDPITIAVIKVSDSFATLWQDLADDMDVIAHVVRPEDPIPSSTCAVILAIGGEEEQGMDVLLTLRDRTSCPVFVVGANTSHRFGAQAIRRGATEYLALPEDLDLLRRMVTARVEAARERQAPAAPEGDAFRAILGQSTALKSALAKAARILPHDDVTVLIGGETGTGKELLARALHDGGPRRTGPFIAVNCAAIPATLLESELFGHEKGAFTDASRTKVGLFEEAHHGTLFLDEVGHLPVPLQGKLLRALEAKSIRRVGGSEDRAIDVRFVAATHVDLKQAVAKGEFRDDLYYRLNVVTLYLPPLRDRSGDLELLAQFFVRTVAARYGLASPPLTPEFIAALRAHTWPGNVRELRHAIERALLLSPSGELDVRELAVEDSSPTTSGTHGIPFPATMAEISRSAALAALQMQGGNKSAAARLLNVSRGRLDRLIEPGGVDDHGD